MPSAALLLVALANPAAAEGLQWNWAQPAPTTFHAEAFINTPVGAHFRAASNVDARALTVELAADLSCTGEQLKKASNVVCTITDIAISGRSFAGEQPKLDTIFESYDKAMTGARIELRVRADGHIQSLSLEGIETTITQSREALEQMRQLTRKLLAPLSIAMPGDAAGQKPWKHKGMPLFFELLTNSGTTGGVMLKYRVDGEASGGGVFVIGEGRGSLNSQNQTQGAGTAGALAMVGASQTRFDPQTGLPFYSEVSVSGNPTAQNQNLTGQARYALAAWVGRTYEDGSIEGLEGRVAAK
jgi:hypothetical protein